MNQRLTYALLIIGIILIAAASLALIGQASPSDPLLIQLLPYHICAAILTYIAFIACTGINIALYVQNIHTPPSSPEQSATKRRFLRTLLTPSTAIVLCDAGLIFALETFITGMVWATDAWGAAWVWEPRLTGMLLMTTIFAAWRIGCSIVGHDTPNKIRYTAPLIILGLPSMVFTHFATDLIGGIHPEAIAPLVTHIDPQRLTQLQLSSIPLAIGHLAIAAAIFGIARHAIAQRHQQ